MNKDEKFKDAFRAKMKDFIAQQKLREQEQLAAEERRLKRYREKKSAVIMFHKNIKKLYSWNWVQKCVQSVLDQSYQHYDILEVNYGGDGFCIMSEFKQGHQRQTLFFNENFDTHTEAMMFLLDLGFNELGYEVIFNTNLDDYYDQERFMLQLKAVLDGYDLCSTYMTYVTEINGIDEHVMSWDDKRYGFNAANFSADGYVDQENIEHQLNKNHNVINHSSMCFTKKFWESFDSNGNLLRYRDDKPFEDLTLWQRAVSSPTCRMTIIPKSLIMYRLHENQIGEQQKTDKRNDAADNGFNLEPSTAKKIIGIFCVCTGNYVQYMKQLVKGVKQHFLPGYDKVFLVATDNGELVSKICSFHKIKHVIQNIHKKGFPLDTLYRYKYFLDFGVKPELYCDVVYYLDVDMKLVSTVDESILPTPEKPLVATRHPGFANENFNGSPETDPESTAYVPEDDMVGIYVAGGFNGGITHYFREMAREIHENIRKDKAKDLIAVWHDESHLNRYFLSHQSEFAVLTPSYCFPENFHIKLDYKPIIVALSKNHNQIRNSFKKNVILVNAIGGLGNLLFQLFYAYSIAMKFNLDVAIDVEAQEQHRQSPYFYHMFDNVLRLSHRPKNMHSIVEIGKSYMDLLKDVPPGKDLFLNGYFQSPLYFKKDFLHIARKYMNFELMKVAKKIMGKATYTAVHIRGGDYLKLMDYHYAQEEGYYLNALEDANSSYPIMLFTDDMEYVTECFDHLSYETTAADFIRNNIPKEYSYLVGNSELEFMVMSLCKIIVCANSTFSLWASYIATLNDVEKVYVPKKWFGFKGPKNFFTEELLFDERFKLMISD